MIIRFWVAVLDGCYMGWGATRTQARKAAAGNGRGSRRVRVEERVWSVRPLPVCPLATPPAP